MAVCKASVDEGFVSVKFREVDKNSRLISSKCRLAPVVYVVLGSCIRQNVPVPSVFRKPWKSTDIITKISWVHGHQAKAILSAGLPTRGSVRRTFRQTDHFVGLWKENVKAEELNVAFQKKKRRKPHTSSEEQYKIGSLPIRQKLSWFQHETKRRQIRT